MEQQAVWEQISNPNAPMTDGSAGVFVAMGPTPENATYGPWSNEIPTLRCPSDPGTGLPALGRTNYGACLGDSILASSHGAADNQLQIAGGASAFAQFARASQRGTFVPHQRMRFRDILDGLANTVIMGEIATDLGDRDTRTAPRTTGFVLATGTITPADVAADPSSCGNMVDPTRPLFWASGVTVTTDASSERGRGYQWANGNPVYSVVHTILPPNSPSCASMTRRIGGGATGVASLGERPTDGTNPDYSYGLMSVSSRHQGGAHVLLGDGAVTFVTDSIEAGDSTAGNVHINGTGAQAPGQMSPYGLWGALGTRASKETIEEEL